MNILIVKTSAIGDVTHTIPALHALHRQYPDAKIDWLVEEAAADLIIGHPYLNRVLVSKRKKWICYFKKGSWCKAIIEVITFIREIRRLKYDLLIDFQGLLKSSIFIAVCRAVRKVGFGKGMDHAEHSYLFLNEKISPVDMNIHAVDREKMLLEGLGVEKDGEYRLPLAECYNAKIEDISRTYGVDLKKPFVVINPMTTWPSKHWHNKGFAELADKIARRRLSIIFTGGMDDKDGINDIISCMKGIGAVNLAGKTDLKTLAALYKKAKVVVSTDTGPMHIAAAMGTPVVALFGPTAPWRTGPYGKKHKIVRLDLSCSPCLKKKCDLGTTACMLGIKVETVMDAVKSIAGVHPVL